MKKIKGCEVEKIDPESEEWKKKMDKLKKEIEKKKSGDEKPLYRRIWYP